MGTGRGGRRQPADRRGLPRPGGRRRRVGGAGKGDHRAAGHGGRIGVVRIGLPVGLRETALGHPAGYAAPALLGAGALLLVLPTGLDDRGGGALLVAGAVAQCLVQAVLWRRQRDDAVLVPALGAVALLGGLVLWVGGADISFVVVWFAGYVVLTIAGERLELARLAMPASAGTVLVLLGGGLAVALPAATLWPEVGSRLLGLLLIGVALWLVAHDVARRTVHGSGLPRFAGACMLAGQVWLLVAGVTWLVAGPLIEGPAYDAALHATFLGFAMSMVMAHAPVILPAVLRRPLPYHPALYVPVGLLHGSLAVRLWVGDALDSQTAWVTGGVLNIVALVGCALSTRPEPLAVCALLIGVSNAVFGLARQVEAKVREDYVGTDDVTYDDDGKPIMAVETVRDEGNDVAVFAPCARAGGKVI